MIALIVFLVIITSFVYVRRNAANVKVYISARGSSDYHVKVCSLLSAEKIKIKRGEAMERGYKPCEKCVLKTDKDKEANNNKKSSNERRRVSIREYPEIIWLS